jgi:signal-transduction protein with cAMP-binding, CBS, and nucleotidyltransferase domain
MLVSQVLAAKGDKVFTTSPSESIESVATRLWSRKVGSLIVMGADGEVIGIVSERDLVRVVAEGGGGDLARPVSDFMSHDVLVAAPGDTVEAMLALMTDRRIRHLPVCEDHRLVGIISIGDLVKSKIADVEAEAEGLRSYITAA